jgi:8-oxo-dGTP diphosphatase
MHEMRECVGALVVRDGRILLALRAPHKTYAECWDVPGGHLEAGETPEDALCRELAEELGIAATAWTFHSTHEDGGVRLHLYIVTRWRGRPQLRGNEHSQMRWHPLSRACELRNLAAAEYREIFRTLTTARRHAPCSRDPSPT